ncbi:hypothetical protein LXL04_021274 [Taraxacum kok-saghyz]
MGDHFVFLVDRLLTESTLEAAIESRNPSYPLSPAIDTMIDCSSHMDPQTPFTPRKMVECRICQDEDFDSTMETPCSCCGSLKVSLYGLYLIVNIFSSKKACTQSTSMDFYFFVFISSFFSFCSMLIADVFKDGVTKRVTSYAKYVTRPGYTAPPPVFRLGGIPANLRGHLQIARRDINADPRIITVVSSDHNLLDQEYDEYADSTARSILCFRSVAVIFMIVLILRHTLPIFAYGGANYSLPVFLLLLIRTSGFILPIYLILRAMTALVHRRRHLVSNGSTSSFSSSDEEAGPIAIQGGGGGV